MKKLPLYLVALGTTCFFLNGCDQSAQERNEVLGRPSSATVSSAQTVEEEVLSLSLSSPDAAAKLAATSPESVATVARSAAEKALSELPSSPESAMARLNAYAQLTKSIAQLTPESKHLEDAAIAIEKARLQAVNTLKAAK